MDVPSACNLLDQTLGSSSESVSSVLKQLVTNLKQLHPAITRKLVEVLYMYPYETTPVVSQLTCGTEKEVCLLIEAFSDLLCSDRNLLVPIVSALGELPLVPKLLFEVRKTVVRALHTVEEKDIPVVVRTLLRTLIWSQERKDVDWIIVEVRNAVKVLETDNLVKIWEVLDDCFRVSPVVCIRLLHSWKRIAISTSFEEFRFTVFDFCLLLCSMQRLRTKNIAVEVLIAVLRRLPNICRSSVQTLIRQFKPIILHHSNPFRVFATCILRMRSIRDTVGIFVTIFEEIKDLRAQLICDLNCAIRQSADTSYSAALCIEEMSKHEEFADSLCSALSVIEDLVAHPHSLDSAVICVLCRFLTQLYRVRPSKTDSIFILLRKQILFGDSAEKRAALALAFYFIPSIDSTESNILINLLCNVIPPCIGHSETGEFLRFLPDAIEKLPLDLVEKLHSSYFRYLLPTDCVVYENGILRYDVTRMARMYPDNLLDVAASISALRCIYTRLNDSSKRPNGWLLVETMVSMLIIELASDKNSSLKHMEIQETELLEAASSCVVAMIVLSNVLNKYSLALAGKEDVELKSEVPERDSHYLFLSRMEELKTMSCAVATILGESRRKFSREGSLYLKKIQKLVTTPCISVYIHSINVLPNFSLDSIETVSGEELDILLAKIDFSIYMWEKLKEKIDSHDKEEATSSKETELRDNPLHSGDRSGLPDSVCFKLFENIYTCNAVLPTLRKHISASRSMLDHSFCSQLSFLFERVQHWLALLFQILRYVLMERISDDEMFLCWSCLEKSSNHEHSVSSLSIETAIEKVCSFVEKSFLSSEEVTLACLSIDTLSPLCHFPKVRLKVLQLYIDSLKTVFPVKNRTLSASILHGIPSSVAACRWYFPHTAKFFRLRKSTSFVSAKYQLISCLSVMCPQFAIAFAHLLISSLASSEAITECEKLSSIGFHEWDSDIFCLDITFEETVQVFINYFSSVLRFWLIGVSYFGKCLKIASNHEIDLMEEFHVPFYTIRESVCCLHDMLQLLKHDCKGSFNPLYLRNLLKRVSNILSVLMSGIDRLTKFPNKFKDSDRFPSRSQLEELVGICKKVAILIRNFAFENLRTEKRTKCGESQLQRRRKQLDKNHLKENDHTSDSFIENVLPSIVYHTDSLIVAAMDWSPVEQLEQSRQKNLESEEFDLFKKYMEHAVSRVAKTRGRTVVREEDIDLKQGNQAAYAYSEQSGDNNIAGPSQEAACSDGSSHSSEDEYSQSDSEFILIDSDFQQV